MSSDQLIQFAQRPATLYSNASNISPVLLSFRRAPDAAVHYALFQRERTVYTQMKEYFQVLRLSSFTLFALRLSFQFQGVSITYILKL